MSRYITDEEKQRIRELTAEGKTQLEIANALGWRGSPMPLRNRVYRWQKQMDLTLPWRGPRSPVLTPEEEKQVLALLKADVGTGRIAAKLNLRPYLVRKFAEEHGFGRKPTQWNSLPSAVREKILEEIRGRQNFGVDLAEKYAAYIGYKAILKVARETLNCPKFRPSRSTSGPLTSDWPQKHHPRGGLST